jgi:hypothetical protein
MPHEEGFEESSRFLYPRIEEVVEVATDVYRTRK